MKEVLSNLKEYQDVIIELRQLKQELSTYPESVLLLEKELKAGENALKSLAAKLEKDNAEKDSKDSYLELCKNNLEKFEHDLMEVTNQKEYSAVLKEIDNTKKEIQSTEKTLIELIDSVKTVNEQTENLTQTVNSKKEEYEKALSEFNSENETKVKRQTELTAIKKDLEQAIDKRYMSRFIQIAKKRAGIAVAVLCNECCSVCNMKIRPQMIHEMKKSPNQIYTCDSCQRILVVDLENENCI